ncbi:MAG: CPBP family intramembrane glutamic endopeptidase, partial [Eubacterium sp.]
KKQRTDKMPQYYYNPFGRSADADEEIRKRFAYEQAVKSQKRELITISLSMGTAIVCYILFQSVASWIMVATDTYDLYKTNPLFQDCFNMIGVSMFSVALPFALMALFNRKRFASPVIPSKNISAKKAFAWISFGMACCVIANFLVSFLILFVKNVFGYQLTQSELLEPDSVLSCISCLISTAVVPAVCEELAMRCCSLQLLRKYGKSFAVFAVSVVFGLLHGNVIQFVFAFIIGVILAFVTIKTDSIYPAIFIHALNNGMSAVQSIVKYAVGTEPSENIVVVFYIFWLAAGVISTIYLLFKKEFAFRTEKNSVLLTAAQKFVCFYCTGMIVPFIILIIFTATTVKKI